MIIPTDFDGYPAHSPNASRSFKSHAISQSHFDAVTRILATSESVSQRVHGVLFTTLIYILWIRAAVDHSWRCANQVVAGAKHDQAGETIRAQCEARR